MIAAFAAAIAVIGAAVMRRWDAHAGKQVADLSRARVSDEWRSEERIAELETDLEESRELRAKLEQRLRAKRAELAGLRGEHAALLRRYATAETERASALEGRRLLEIENTAPVDEPAPAGKRDEPEKAPETASEAPQAPAAGIFSPEGSKLFLRANDALDRLGGETGTGKVDEEGDAEADAPGESAAVSDAAEVPEDGVEEKSDEPAAAEVAPAEAESAVSSASPATKTGSGATKTGSGEEPGKDSAREDDAHGKSEASDGHTRAVTGEAEQGGEDLGKAVARQSAGETSTSYGAAALEPAAPAGAPVRRPAGHYAVPTAVAVVPAAEPVRRPMIQGGFDFFGTKGPEGPDALEAVQNEDLADVVGQEALALHKAEAEFKPVDEASRGVGQVVDLTAHDDTEQFDLQGLRSAVS